MRVHSMALGPSLEEIRHQVGRYEAIGLDGVIANDHLFFSRGQTKREANHDSDPFIPLAVAGALSERLFLGTGVANVGSQHPAMPLRQFVELVFIGRLHLCHLIIGAAMGYEEIERFRKEVVSSA